ncbi:hypothetical protein Ahy_A08g040728 isoform C [Arachis hypogaea]|uniref:Aminotransferase class I/classII domain-containing protein n=1 Tax=Arachis hypogaea TaxID=3818 RepID=A0A445C0K2_ARAHY|nr:hypothetical protein Ahy_A08g040728 isoform C [Arachis hypogaea]
MENGGNSVNYESKETSTMTIKGILSLLMQSTVENKNKRVISLGLGDPTLFSCFQTTSVSEEAVADTLLSHNFHGYAPTAGLLQTRQGELMVCDDRIINTVKDIVVDDVKYKFQEMVHSDPHEIKDIVVDEVEIKSNSIADNRIWKMRRGRRMHSGCKLRLGRSGAYVAEILRTSVAQMLPCVTS